jgi:hypothetical protein
MIKITRKYHIIERVDRTCMLTVEVRTKLYWYRPAKVKVQIIDSDIANHESAVLTMRRYIQRTAPKNIMQIFEYDDNGSYVSEPF